MNYNKLQKLIVCLIAMMTFLINVDRPVFANEQPIISIAIKGEINGGQAALVHRAMADANSKGAKAVLIEIDTFGGLVDAAVSIRDMIVNSPVTTICYVKNRAWSAGALIALSHKHIAIAPGGSIGAAEPIPTTEKTVAALKAEFAATANRTGRNPKVAEAMVDKSLGFPGYAEQGQILALTDYQAIQVGYADVVAPNREAVMTHFGFAGEVIEYNMGWQEKLAGWLSDPTVKSLLMSIIFLAVLTEIKTAGMGVAALIGIGAALLFFSSQWLTGIAGWLEVILFAGGIILLIIELYVPGTGVFGIAGIIAIIASLFLTLGANATAVNMLALSLAGAIVIFLLIVRRLPTSRLWSKFILKDAETTKAGFTSSSQDYSVYLNKTGTVLTDLRPAGAVVIDGVQLDVVSEGQFVGANSMVKVVKVTGNRIVVRPVKD